MAPARSNTPLWGICTAAFVAFGALWLGHARDNQEVGWDFAQFYLAAKLPLDNLYDHTLYLAQAEKLRRSAGVRYFPPYVRPAVFAVVLRPLGWFPYWTAFWIWAALAAASYTAALGLLRRAFPFPPEALLGWALFYPPMHAIWEGQDSAGVLLLVVASFLALRAEREQLAGGLLALSAYKFNLFLLLPLYLAAQRRWIAARYAAAGAAGLAAVSALLCSPAAYIAYLQHIPDMTIGFGPETMPGWRSWTAGRPLLYGLAAALTAAACWWGMRRAEAARGFAIALTGSLLVSPHVTRYDLTLLAIPIALVLTRGSWWERLPALLLLVGVPLWFGSPRYVALLVAGLLAALVAGSYRQMPTRAAPQISGAQ